MYAKTTLYSKEWSPDVISYRKWAQTGVRQSSEISKNEENNESSYEDSSESSEESF